MRKLKADSGGFFTEQENKPTGDDEEDGQVSSEEFFLDKILITASIRSALSVLMCGAILDLTELYL